jgi:hypothetical protein
MPLLGAPTATADNLENDLCLKPELDSCVTKPARAASTAASLLPFNDFQFRGNVTNARDRYDRTEKRRHIGLGGKARIFAANNAIEQMYASAEASTRAGIKAEVGDG